MNLSLVTIGIIAASQPADPGLLPPLVSDARTGLAALIGTEWVAEANALVIDLNAAEHYDLHLSQRGLWHLAGVPAGVLIGHSGMTCTLTVNGEDSVVGRTDGPVTLEGVIRGAAADAGDVPTRLTIWFDVPSNADDRPVQDAWDIDCDGQVSQLEWRAITSMLMTNSTAGVVGFDPPTVAALSGVVPIPSDPACPHS